MTARMRIAGTLSAVGRILRGEPCHARPTRRPQSRRRYSQVFVELGVEFQRIN